MVIHEIQLSQRPDQMKLETGISVWIIEGVLMLRGEGLV